MGLLRIFIRHFVPLKMAVAPKLLISDQIVAPKACSIPARGEFVESLPSIFKLAGSDLTLSRREVLQENRITERNPK